MGIFSLFGKKKSQPARKPAAQDSSQNKRDDNTVRGNAQSEQARVQRKAANATALKIDAIESEMSSEFVKPYPTPGNTLAGSPFQHTDLATRAANTRLNTNMLRTGDTTLRMENLATLPMMGSCTAFLMGHETMPGPVAISSSEAAPAIEEAAILFANGQTMLVEPILLTAIEEDNVGNTPQIVWGMLFDLYQITGQRISYENLSIDYASKFEMSPPAWVENTSGLPESTLRPSVTPGVAFSGRLDVGIVKQLERIKNMSEMNKVLKLEFARVTGVDPIGCGLLLNVLKKLQKSGHDLILVGASDLVDKIRAIVQVGRRDETEAPWMLLLELLRLLNREAEFEEASIDYCVTFEVSPPAFVAPQSKVVTETEESVAFDEDSVASFMLPTLIEARATDDLIKNILVFAHDQNPAVLDCTRLQRMDFNAASKLFAGLAPVINEGKVIELRNANHFIVALCNVMGAKEAIHVIPRKN